MIFITLLGKQDSGKTTSIKMLANELLRLGNATQNPQFIDNYPKQYQRSCIDQQKLQKCGNDLLNHKGDITIKFKWNGKNIGITSFGDDPDSIKTKYDLFGDCDIFVSAAHPDDATIKYIKTIAKNSPHIMIGKSTVKSVKLPQDKNKKDIECLCNESTAKELFEIIRYIL